MPLSYYQPSFSGEELDAHRTQGNRPQLCSESLAKPGHTLLTSQPGPRTDLHLVPSAPTSPILPMCSFNHERAPYAGSLGSRPGFRVTSRLKGANPDQRRRSWRFRAKKGCILGEFCMGAGVQERWRLAWRKSIWGRLWPCLVWPFGERGGVRGGRLSRAEGCCLRLHSSRARSAPGTDRTFLSLRRETRRPASLQPGPVLPMPALPQDFPEGLCCAQGPRPPEHRCPPRTRPALFPPALLAPPSKRMGSGPTPSARPV